MANYPQELAQDAMWQIHTGHMTGLWFLPARPLRLNTNERMNIFIYLYLFIYIYKSVVWVCYKAVEAISSYI